MIEVLPYNKYHHLGLEQRPQHVQHALDMLLQGLHPRVLVEKCSLVLLQLRPSSVQILGGALAPWSSSLGGRARAECPEVPHLSRRP